MDRFMKNFIPHEVKEEQRKKNSTHENVALIILVIIALYLLPGTLEGIIKSPKEIINPVEKASNKETLRDEILFWLEVKGKDDKGTITHGEGTFYMPLKRVLTLSEDKRVQVYSIEKIEEDNYKVQVRKN